METVTTEYTDDGWNEVAEGAGEFQIDATAATRYAYGDSSGPDGTVLGTLLPANEPVVVVLPVDTSLWLRHAGELGVGGAYQVNVTEAA